MAILPALDQLSREQLIEMLIAAKTQQSSRITFKVTAEKTDPKTGKTTGTNGAIAVYGLGRFPVTLYWSQWERLLDQSEALRAFAAEHRAKLATKP